MAKNGHECGFHGCHCRNHSRFHPQEYKVSLILTASSGNIHTFFSSATFHGHQRPGNCSSQSTSGISGLLSMPSTQLFSLDDGGVQVRLTRADGLHFLLASLGPAVQLLPPHEPEAMSFSTRSHVAIFKGCVKSVFESLWSSCLLSYLTLSPT
jgi:hypothetical protein